MNAVFRCDATEDIGFGHLSRCIALAEAFRLLGAQSTFFGQFDLAAKEQTAVAGFECIELTQPVNTETAVREHAAISAVHDADFIVVDSYRLDEPYLSDLKALGQTVVVIDDFCPLATYDCSAVLNFTWEANSLGYPEGPTLLLGPNYLLARRRLIEARPSSFERHRQGPVQNLLVAVGGTDPKGITSRLIRLLREDHSGLCVRALAKNTSELSSLMKDFSPGSDVLPRQPDLSEQLRWADAAITGGGLIKYESAYMGVPAAAIAQNEGQDGETQVLSRAGLVFDLGLADKVTDQEVTNALDTFISNTELRSVMATQMRETFVSDPTAHAARAILEAVRR